MKQSGRIYLLRTRSFIANTGTTHQQLDCPLHFVVRDLPEWAVNQPIRKIAWKPESVSTASGHNSPTSRANDA